MVETLPLTIALCTYHPRMDDTTAYTLKWLSLIIIRGIQINSGNLNAQYDKRIGVELKFIFGNNNY